MQFVEVTLEDILPTPLGYCFLFIYLFIVLRFQTSYNIALKKLGHHNSLTPITVGPLQNININIENRNN
jgi:hypothetical protein